MKSAASGVEKREQKNMLGRVGVGLWVIFGGVAAVFVGEFLAASLSGVLLSPLSLSGTQETAVSYIITQAITIALLIGLIRVFKVHTRTLGLGKVGNWNFFFLLPLLYLICLAASAMISMLIVWLVPGFDVDQAQELGLAQPPNQFDLVLLGVLLVVLVPLAEEFIFRGYLFGMLRREFPFWLTAVVTSAIFGVAHGQWNVALDTFILSLVLCFLREKTGSIWTGVGLHALKNLVAFLLLFVYNVL